MYNLDLCISSRNVRRAEVVIFTYGWLVCLVLTKVIIEKSRGEGSFMEQDTIENILAYVIFFLPFFSEYTFLLHSMPKMFSTSTMFFDFFLPMKT